MLRHMPYQILLADDHSLILKGLRAAILEVPSLSIVAEASNGIEAISAIKRHKPDCALLDFQMPGANGLEIMRTARVWSAQTRFVLLTALVKPALLQESIDSGFDSVFLKDTPVDVLIEGLHRICDGETVIPDDVKLTMANSDQRPQLTRREKEILGAIAQGLSNAQTSETLGISPKTVESHRANLMKKLEVHSTASLLVRAFREGLIDDDGAFITG